MNTKRLILIAALALLGAALLSACSGAPLSNNWHGVAADAERAYLSGGSFIYAIDLKTGKQVWKFPAESDSNLLFYAPPALVGDERLLVGSAGATHSFFSLNPKDGKETWAEPFTTSKGAWLAAPLILNDTIYAPNADGLLYIMDLNGKEAAAPIELGGALWSAPVSDGKLLYISSLDHYVHIVNPADRSVKSVKLGGAAPSSPALGEGGAYAGSFDFAIQFVTPDGENKSVAEVEDWIWGSPVVDGGALYYADLKGNIVSLDLAGGKENWKVTQKDDAVVAGLLVDGERIYAAVEGKTSGAGALLALDRDGKLVWEKAPGGKIYTAPVGAGELILVAPYQVETFLAAYDRDGKQVWAFAPEE